MSKNSLAGASKSGYGELTNRILFLLGALVVFRIGSHIPIPYINAVALESMMNAQQGTILDMFNMFSGGSLSRLSIFTLGIMPYISAAIVMQLLTYIVPTLEQLRKEGEQGKKVITKYTRYGTVLLATFQSLGIAFALESQTAGNLSVVIDPGLMFRITTVITLVTGTLFLMWLGEQITERGVGNGISIIIFASIVAGLPQAFGGTFSLVNTGELSSALILGILFLIILVVFFVTFMESSQRHIRINYAQQRQARGNQQSSYLPFKINMAGVIPAIFGSAIILFPATIASWSGDPSASEASWLSTVAAQLSPGQPLYITLYGFSIIFFCFFYTSLVFNPKETADNLKKGGAFIPGIRPGQNTANFISKVMGNLTTIGAIYVTAVCLLPEFLILEWNVPFYFGGTSLLIIVIVIMDFMNQVQTHLMSHKYEGLMKKANLKI